MKDLTCVINIVESLVLKVVLMAGSLI